ncbi:hypothetical protein JVU11DRAFT_2148 [Chiua virens]|nr:hypothetical protein JVU11DRAFT_2148 [Chiua virens]
MQSHLTSPQVTFCCVSCHWKVCRHSPAPYIGFLENGNPVLPSFLEVKGVFESSSKANIYMTSTLFLHFQLNSIQQHTHFDLVEHALRDYYPEDGHLVSVDVPFDLAKDKAQLKWLSKAGKIVSRLCASNFKHIVAVITNHTDEEHSDLWLGNCDKVGEPSACAPDKWMDLVLGPFKQILQGCKMYLVLCRTVMCNQEAFSALKAGLQRQVRLCNAQPGVDILFSFGVCHALAFNAVNLLPIKTADLLMNITKSVVLCDIKFVNALEEALKHATMIGKHTAIIHIMKQKTTKYVWTHKKYKP